MNKSHLKGTGFGRGSLEALPTVPAEEFVDWGREGEKPYTSSPTESKNTIFASEQEYRFCRAVVEHPMQSSSAYPKLARISPKSAQPIRQQLVSRGFLSEHQTDSSRGRSTIRLAPLPAGIQAVREYQNQENQS